jgi:CBS domain containing-hemolysin-like protein
MSEFVQSITIWLPGIAVMTTLVLFSGFFSCSETALFFLSRDQIRAFSKGNSGQKLVATLMADPDRLLTAILFWNLLINLAYFTVSFVVMHRLSNGGFNRVAAVLAVGSLLAIIAFGEVLPKSLAVAFRQSIAPPVSRVLVVSLRVLDPLLPGLGGTARAMRRIFWPGIQSEPNLDPRDLEHAIDASAATSHDMLQIEQQILHNILDLSEIRTEEILRPRSHCVLVSPDQTFDDLKRPARGLSYLLVQAQGEHHVRAAVALDGIATVSNRSFGDLAERVIYVPWCATLAYTFSELQRQYCGVAVVVNELSEMLGIVTYEDILSTMLTERPSRTRRLLKREPVIRIGQNRFHADGLVTLRYLSTLLRVDFESEDDEQHTIGGLFHDRLERIAHKDDVVHWNGWRLVVIETQKRGHIRVLIEPIPTMPSSSGSESHQ